MKRLKSSLLFAALTMGCSIGMANDVDVKTFRYAGPFELSQPVLVDSVDAQQKAFSAESLLNTPLNLDLAQQGRVINGGKLLYLPLSMLLTYCNSIFKMLAIARWVSNLRG
nr:hypothetical protein [Hoylesella shahii]